jgi:hypothetical protein
VAVAADPRVSGRAGKERAVDDDAMARVDALLQGYESELDGRRALRAREAAESRAVRDRFVALRADVIEPTMRAFGEYLRSRGHDYEIRSHETRDVGAGRNDEPSIALTVYPGAPKRREPRNAPTLTFRSGDVPGQLRAQFVNAPPGGGHSSVGRVYPLDAVTTAVVRGAILELLEAVLDRRRA